MKTTFAPPEEKLYICPGETHPITRAVHLSRLAAFFPACRDCPFRGETGHMPRQTVEQFRSTEKRAERGLTFTAEGLRGVYLNQIDRKEAERIAAAFASLLWDDAPLMGRVEGGAATSRRPGPSVVVGHDDRPASPDIITGAVAALRRMGCQVIDIGLTTKPCFWFAADHLQAAAGLFVTGAGCDPSWTGIDFVGRGALPLSARHTRSPTGTAARLDLDRLQARLRERFDRPTRGAGTHRTFQATIPYEAGLRKHFHALRPLTIVVATPVRPLRRTFSALFETLPGRLILDDAPCRARNTVDPADPDVQRLGERVIRERAHLGFHIDDDGQRCAVCDERGSLVPPAAVTRLLVTEMLREHPRGPIVLEPGFEPPLPAAKAAAIRATAPTFAAISTAIREHQSVFAGGSSGRYWFREAFPTSDAVLTLARLLAALSRSDADLSDLADNDSANGKPDPH